MVLKPEPIFLAVEDVLSQHEKKRRTNATHYSHVPARRAVYAGEGGAACAEKSI